MQEKEQQARGAEVPQPADVIRAIQERAPQPVRCQRILVPTDGSGQAFKAVLDAIHLAAATGAELTLLMVVDYNKNVAAFEQVSLGGYVPAELKVAAYRFLADLMHLIPSEIRAQPRVEAGDPRELIAAWRRRRKATSSSWDRAVSVRSAVCSSAASRASCSSRRPVPCCL